MDIQVYDRRGAAEELVMSSQGGDPLDEASHSYELHLAKQDQRRRSWEGEGEFEPAFFNTLDDAEDLREMALDPALLFQTGVTVAKKEYELLTPKFNGDTFGLWAKLRPAPKNDKGGYDEEVIRINFFTPVCVDEYGESTTWNSWVKVSPIMYNDWGHVEEFKMPRFGDNSLSLTHGEQEEVHRMSGGSRLKEDELSGDFRTSSKFLLDDILFLTVDFELPNFPQDVQKWLDDVAWPNHDNLKAALIKRLAEIRDWKVPDKDNRLKEVKAERRAEQADQLKRRWGRFWHWWTDKCGHAKAKGRRKPMSNRQLASIKAIIEQFRSAYNYEVPVIKFWARVHCMTCNVSRGMLLPLSYQPMYEEETDEVIGLDEINYHEKLLCETCKTETSVVLWFEDHAVLNGSREPDWFDIAQKLSDKINALYMIGATIDEIKPLESRLHFIEVTHIRIDAHQLLWGEYDAIDSRYC